MCCVLYKLKIIFIFPFSFSSLPAMPTLARQYLFLVIYTIWMCQVLVAAAWIFDLHCSMQDLQLQNAESSSPTQD